MTGIRTITEDDLGSIRELILQLSEDLGEVFDIDAKLVAEHYQVMQKHSQMYQNFVYCIDDEVVSFLSVVLYRSFFHKKGTALINELVVKKGYRGQQIGSRMLKHALAIAQEQGMDEIEVGVMADNTRALDFYRRNGLDEEYLLLGKEFS